MKVSLIQPQICSNLSTTLDHVEEMIDHAAKEQADLVILPELWTSPFINSVIFEHQEDWEPALSMLKRKAKEHGLWIIGGTIPRKENGKLYNSCPVLSPDGELITHADKLHLLEVHTSKNIYREADVFAPGNHFCSFETPWGKIGIVICYDLRFPETVRLLGKDSFLIAAPAGFNDSVGPKHWQPLLQTRSMENEVFVAGVNPAWQDHGSYRSYGHSLMADPDGQVTGALEGKEGILTIEIDPDQVHKIRKRSPFWDLRRTDLYSLEQH